MSTVTILDGPLGTELVARGVETPIPRWSAAALQTAPAVVSQIHRDYVAAGAVVHTACTFRTTPRVFPESWEPLARLAVRLAREAVPPGQRVAGSIAPLEDCYSPWLSPPDPAPEHRELAGVLAGAGCDLLLVETFPHPGEALVAVEQAVATGVETWASFTPGPDATLLDPEQVRRAARAAVDRGAAAVLVNCVAVALALPYVEALAGLGVPFGAYANAGAPEERMGWQAWPEAPARYLEHAERWVEAGATLVGACCGVRPDVIATLARRFGAEPILGHRVSHEDQSNLHEERPR